MIDALYRHDDGVPVPDFDPKLLNMLRDFDLNKPLPELWPQFAGLAGVPMLAIRGGNSNLLSAATLAEMARRHPDCQTVTVEGQGHAPLLETGHTAANHPELHQPGRAEGKTLSELRIGCSRSNADSLFPFAQTQKNPAVARRVFLIR